MRAPSRCLGLWARRWKDMVTLCRDRQGCRQQWTWRYSRASWGTREYRKLEMACQGLAAWLRHRALEGPCHGNCLAFQGKKKKKTVKKLLSLMQTLNPQDTSSATLPFLLAYTHACVHMHTLTWNADQMGHTAFPSYPLQPHPLTTIAKTSLTGSPGPMACCMIGSDLLVLIPLLLHLHELQKGRSQSLDTFFSAPIEALHLWVKRKLLYLCNT